MSNSPLAISEQELNTLTKNINALQVEVAGDSPSCAKRAKLSARDILATLSSRRIFISEIQFIGESTRDGGTYGDVVAATFVKAGGNEEQGRRVAVKKLRFIINGDMTEEKFLRVFVNELRVLDGLSHPNIVEIVGFVEDIENRIAWLVFPWEDNGNLREFLRSEEWEIPERVSLILDVALGLEYLHTHEPPICHGDLKSLNILVNSSNRAVITDFGSARIIRRTQEANANPATQPAASASPNRPESDDIPQLKITTSETALTLTGPACSLRWSPPEVLNGESLDLATDIWALGWVAWEAITDCYPFEEVKADWSISMKIIEGRLPLIRDHTQLSQIYPLCSLMQKCWKLEPKERPSVTECRKALWLMPWSIPVISREKSKIRSVALLLQVGQMHRLQERYEEASKAYLEGLTITHNPMTAEFGDVLVELGRNRLERSEHVEPEAAYPEALAILESLRGDFGPANDLRHEHARRARSEEPSYTQAMFTYNMMVEKLGLANTFRGLGQEQLSLTNTFRALGQEQQARSMYVAAEESYTQALAIYESIGNDLGRAHARRGLGGVHLAQSNYIEAEASYTQALAIYQSVGDDPGRAGCSLGLGQIRLRQAQYAEAKTLITNASMISEQIGYGWGKRLSQQLLEEVDEAEKAPTFMPSSPPNMALAQSEVIPTGAVPP